MERYAFMFMQATLCLYGAERNTILIYLRVYLLAMTELTVYGASHFTYSAVYSILNKKNKTILF